MTKDITEDVTDQSTAPVEGRNIPEDLLTLGQAAEILQVSAKTVDRWTKDRRIQVYLLPSGHRRYRRIDLESLITMVPATKAPKMPAFTPEESS